MQGKKVEGRGSIELSAHGKILKSTYRTTNSE